MYDAMLIHRTQVGLNPNGDSWTFLLLRYADKPESIIRLPFLFRAYVSRIVLSFIKDVADYINKKLSLDSTYYVMTHPIHFQYFTITIPRH